MEEADRRVFGRQILQGLADFFTGVVQGDRRCDEHCQDDIYGPDGGGTALYGEGDGFTEPRRQDCKGEDHRVRIGRVFRSDEREKEEDDSSVDEEESGTVVTFCKGADMLFPAFEETIRQDEAPREKSSKIDDEIEIPDVLAGVFRYGGAQDIVDTEEIEDEVAAVHGVHGAVPRTGDDEEESHARDKMDVEHFLQVFLIY